jgi:hypothetical protein
VYRLVLLDRKRHKGTDRLVVALIIVTTCCRLASPRWIEIDIGKQTMQAHGTPDAIACATDNTGETKHESHEQAITLEHIEGEVAPRLHLKTFSIVAVSFLLVPHCSSNPLFW